MMEEDRANWQEVEEIRLAREQSMIILDPLKQWQREFVLSYLREKITPTHD